MIDKQTFAIKFVIQDDVLDQVRATGETNEDEVKRRGQKIWKDVCFVLDIYRSVKGAQKTQAEFMQQWLWDGYNWDACIEHLRTLRPVKHCPKRDLTDEFKVATMKRLREHVAATYRPKAGSEEESLDEAEAGGDPS